MSTREMDFAERWMALFFRARVLDQLSPASRNLEEREIDRLAAELVKAAQTAAPPIPPLPVSETPPITP